MSDSKTPRPCLVCGRHPSATLPEYPALCERCLDRAGAPVKPGDRVVNIVDERCSGFVVGIEDDTTIIVRTASGSHVHLPIEDLITIDHR